MVFLDTNIKDNIFESKNLEELNDINKISIDGVRQFSLPDTELNKLALYDNIGPNTFGLKEVTPILVDAGGNGNILRQHLLYVISYDKKGCTYQVELRNGDEHWLTCIDALLLCDLEVGNFIFSFDKIIEAQTNNCVYQDGAPCYTFPDVYYGGWHNSDYLTINDYRPWFHLLGLLQKIFCQCGWSFRSPVFETDYWRHFITYVATKNFNEQPGLLEFRRFRASINSIGVDRDRINFDEEFDNGGNYDDGYYTGAGEIEFCLTLKGTLENTRTGSGSGIFSLVHDKPNGDSLVVRSITTHIKGTEDVENEVTEGFSFTFCETITTEEGDRVYVKYSGNGVDVIEIIGDFYSNPKKASVIEGDEISLQSYLDCDITGLDYFKGALHLIDGKILTDFKSKTVTVFTPYDATWNEELAEGYFSDDIEITDIADIAECDSIKISKKNPASERYVRLQFAKTNDQFIEDNFEDDNPPLSKTVDFGASFSEKTRVNANPLFESTVMDTVIMPSTINGQGATRAAHLPVLSDNDKGEVSSDIGPRILYTECFARVFDPESGLVNRHQINTNSPALQHSLLIEGYTYAYSSAKWLIDGEVPIGYVGYGENDNDFYVKAYARTLLERYYASTIGYNICTDINRCSLIDFRKKHLLRTDCDSFIFHIGSISNQVLCGKGIAGVVGIPSLPFNPCSEEDDGIANLCNQNNLTLVKAQAGTTYSFTVEGTIVTALEYQTVEWKLHDDESYTVLSSPYTVTDPQNNFIVRLKYKTEGCPEKSVTIPCPICREESEIVSFYYDQEADLLSIIKENDPFFNVATDTVFWSDTHGCDDMDFDLNSTAYTVPFSVPENTVVYAQRVIKFLNDCPDLEQCIEIMVPPSDLDCTQNDFSYDCEVVGGLLTFNYTGQVFGKTQVDIIFWRPLGSTDPFKIWDGMTPIPCPAEHYRSVVFCDDICVPSCSPTDICDCEECTNDGIIADTCEAGEASTTFTPSFSEVPTSEVFEIVINSVPQLYTPGDLIPITETDMYFFRWTIQFPTCGELILTTDEVMGCCQPFEAGDNGEISICE